MASLAASSAAGSASLWAGSLSASDGSAAARSVALLALSGTKLRALGSEKIKVFGIRINKISLH